MAFPYRLGGTNAETGFDCSGFVRAIYSQTMGKVLPRVSAEQANATQQIDRNDLKPGDLVFFNTMRRTFSHVGIYVGDGKFIHAPRTGASVRVESMQTSYWARRFDGARRVEGADASATTAAAYSALGPCSPDTPSGAQKKRLLCAGFFRFWPWQPASPSASMEEARSRRHSESSDRVGLWGPRRVTFVKAPTGNRLCPSSEPSSSVLSSV